ncbi:MAG: RNA polymerase sigma factor [Fimbriiglobus sp.]
MSLLPVDRDLLQRCLAKQPGAWNDFVDRFLSLIYHVVQNTAYLRSAKLAPEDTEDIAAEVLLQIVSDDYRVIRQFRGQANLSTYLTVVARRICVHELNRRQQVRDSIRRGDPSGPSSVSIDLADETAATQKGLESLDEVERLLRQLKGTEREVVRLFYLEGRSYEEISTETNVPVNTIGAVLSRARKKLREAAQQAGGGGSGEFSSLQVAAGVKAAQAARKVQKPPQQSPPSNGKRKP